MICSGARRSLCHCSDGCLRWRPESAHCGYATAMEYIVFSISRTRPRGVLVLHAFTKKSQATLKQDRELGKKRLREMLDEDV